MGEGPTQATACVVPFQRHTPLERAPSHALYPAKPTPLREGLWQAGSAFRPFAIHSLELGRETTGGYDTLTCSGRMLEVRQTFS